MLVVPMVWQGLLPPGCAVVKVRSGVQEAAQTFNHTGARRGQDGLYSLSDNQQVRLLSRAANNSKACAHLYHPLAAFCHAKVNYSPVEIMNWTAIGADCAACWNG
jgi:hypothetical protein